MTTDTPNNACAITLYALGVLEVSIESHELVVHEIAERGWMLSRTPRNYSRSTYSDGPYVLHGELSMISGWQTRRKLTSGTLQEICQAIMEHDQSLNRNWEVA